MTGGLSTNFHGVGIGPLSNILAVKGSFTNYVYSKMWVGSQKMSTFIM